MKTVWYTILVLITLATMAIIWQFGSAVFIFLLSLAFAAAVRPVIESLKRLGMHRALAMVISFSLIVLVFIGLVVLSSGPLTKDFQNSGNDLQRSYEWVKNVWLQSDSNLLSNFASQLPSSNDIYNALTGEASGATLRAVLGVAEGSFSFIARVFLVLVLSIYWAADQVHFERLWLSILPVKTRRNARNIWQALESGVGSYIRREVSLSVVSGVLLWLGYLLLGIEYPVMLAVFAMFARLVPWLGSLLVIFLPLIFGSIYGVGAAVIAVLFTFIILVVLDVILAKRFFPKQHYSSLLLVLISITMAISYGLIGVILATMLTIALQIIVDKLLKQSIHKNRVSDTQSISNLKTKIELIKDKLDSSEAVIDSESVNLLLRLENLIKDAGATKNN